MFYWLVITLCISQVNCKLDSVLGINKFDCSKYVLNKNWYGRRHVVISDKQNDLSRNIIAHIPHVYSTYSDLEYFLMTLYEKPDSYSVVANSAYFLEATLDTIINSPVYDIAKYTIFIDDEMDANAIAGVLWSFRLPNSMILQTKANRQELEIHTVAIRGCGSSVGAEHALTLRKHVDCTSLPEIPNFNFKNSFLGCPLRVSSTIYEPFVYWSNHTWGWKGIFIDFLEPLGKISGRQVIISPTNPVYYLDMKLSYSFDTLLEDLQNETQLFAGGIEYRVYESFHLSPVITDDNLVLICPKPLANYWANLFSGITYRFIAIGCLIFVVIGFLIHYLNRMKSDDAKQKSSSVLDILGSLFSSFLGTGGFQRMSSSWPLRFFLGVVLFSSVEVNIFLQGQLLRAMTGSKYGRPISSLRQLADSKLPSKMLPVMASYLQSHGHHNEDIRRIVGRFESLGDMALPDIVDLLIKEKNFAALSVSSVLLMRPNIHRAFSYIPYETLHMCLAMKKHEYSSPQIYEWIARMLETGFLAKYEKLHFFQLALKFNVEEEEKQFIININQVWDALYILFCGYVVSAVVLVCEIVFCKCKRFFEKLLSTTVTSKRGEV